jgi:hypothetical protein
MITGSARIIKREQPDQQSLAGEMNRCVTLIYLHDGVESSSYGAAVRIWCGLQKPMKMAMAMAMAMAMEKKKKMMMMMVRKILHQRREAERW